MKFISLQPILWTTDLDSTLDFYRENLGFETGEHNEEIGWALLVNGETSLMISRPNEHMPFEKCNFTGSFYFTVDSVDALWEKLKDKVKVCYGIEDFYYGMREFAIFDNNGYILQFGSPIESENAAGQA